MYNAFYKMFRIIYQIYFVSNFLCKNQSKYSSVFQKKSFLYLNKKEIFLFLKDDQIEKRSIIKYTQVPYIRKKFKSHKSASQQIQMYFCNNYGTLMQCLLLNLSSCFLAFKDFKDRACQIQKTDDLNSIIDFKQKFMLKRSHKCRLNIRENTKILLARKISIFYPRFVFVH